MFNHALACSLPIINKLQPFLESEKSEKGNQKVNPLKNVKGNIVIILFLR